MQVSYLGAYFLARSTDAALFTGNVAEFNETLYGFTWADGQAASGSIAVGYQFDAGPSGFVVEPSVLALAKRVWKPQQHLRDLR